MEFKCGAKIQTNFEKQRELREKFVLSNFPLFCAQV